jgi:uncharacterized protein (DUF2141 family)
VVLRDLPLGSTRFGASRWEWEREMDMNMMRVPKEGYGVSNNPKKKMRADV